MKYIVSTLLFVSACTTNVVEIHPYRSEASRQFSTAYCARLKSCSSPEYFTTIYPQGGESECVDYGVSLITNGTAFSACTEDEMNLCAKNVQDLDCSSTLIGVGPDSCAKCLN